MNLYINSIPADPDEAKSFNVILDGKRVNVRDVNIEREYVDGDDGYPYPTGRTIIHLKFYGEVTRGND
jgi:hypothetical protein